MFRDCSAMVKGHAFFDIGGSLADWHKGQGPARAEDAGLVSTHNGARHPVGDEKSATQGHRHRLRARFLSGGEAALPDYELLELLLFAALPRRDTKPLAKTLLKQFGDFASVIAADPSALRQVKGVGDAVVMHLKIIEAAAHRLGQVDLQDRTLLTSWDQLERYLRMRMGRLEHEEFRVLFLDRQNGLLADEMQQQGTVDQVAVYPREITRRALELKASALILAHNHPSGRSDPSQSDIEMTMRIRQACDVLDITVHDHVIVSRKGCLSMFEQGFFDAQI